MRDARDDPTSDAWRLVAYVLPSGNCPVCDFFDGLALNQPRFFVTFNEHLKPRLEEHGPFVVGPPYWEGLGDGLYEIRWNHCRVYCSVEPARRVMMYMGVIKRWPKFSRHDRRTCNTRRDDVQSKEYDEESRGLRYHAYRQRRRSNGLA